MKEYITAIFLTCSLLSGVVGLNAQSTDYPLIGAQVFIQPGQSGEQIREWFSILKEQKMEVCRVRMFEDHMKRPDGSWDFSLYDQAFDAAAANGVKIFATLFPLNGSGEVGGFKFPQDTDHEKSISNYIEKVVIHFKDHPALYNWVLINEIGRSKLPMHNAYTRDRFEAWKAAHTIVNEPSEYERLPHYEDAFFRIHNTEYLSWLANEVRKHDSKTYLHVNTHAIHHILHQFEYRKWNDILSSHGSSLHPSWHFGDFDRDQYALAVASANDIVREAGGTLPFWVTELQGGNNTASSVFPFCPTEKEIAQWLWVSVASGAEGIIFWTLNARAVGFEAGEWGMLDYTNQPSDRLLMAGRVAESIQTHKDIFKEATTVQAKIHLFYNKESYFSEKRRFVFNSDDLGRNRNAAILSVMSYYEALVEQGVNPHVTDLDYFEVEAEDYNGEVAILPNLVGMTRVHWDRVTRFVERGGKLIVSGLTGYYNEFGQSAFLLNDYPSEMLGARLSEFKVAEEKYFQIDLENSFSLPAHMWRGYLNVDTARVIAREEGVPVGTRNQFGKGEVVWIPSLLGLGSWKRDNDVFAKWLREECGRAVQATPVFFKERMKHTQLRLLDCGDRYLGVFINTDSSVSKFKLEGMLGKKKAEVLFSTSEQSMLKGNTVTLGGNETFVVLWEK